MYILRLTKCKYYHGIAARCRRVVRITGSVIAILLIASLAGFTACLCNKIANKETMAPFLQMIRKELRDQEAFAAASTVMEICATLDPQEPPQYLCQILPKKADQLLQVEFLHEAIVVFVACFTSISKLGSYQRNISIYSSLMCTQAQESGLHSVGCKRPFRQIVLQGQPDVWQQPHVCDTLTCLPARTAFTIVIICRLAKWSEQQRVRSKELQEEAARQDYKSAVQWAEDSQKCLRQWWIAGLWSWLSWSRTVN